jgi:AcrR family transcriptional regulator
MSSRWKRGISKQLIHHYFRTKEELYIAVMDNVSACAIEELSSLDYENHKPAQAIQLFLQGAFDMFVRWPYRYPTGCHLKRRDHGNHRLFYQR